MNNDKFIRLAGTLDRIAKICAGIFRALIIVLLVFCALVLIFGDKMFDQSSLSMELAFIKLYLAPEYRSVTSMVKIYAVTSLLCATVGCAFLTCVCTILRELLAPIKEGRPFEKSVARNLRKIGWLTLIAGFVNQALVFIKLHFLIKAYPMDEIFSSPAIERLEFKFVLDFNFILIFFVFLFLSYIFSYGHTLQQESDETL